jgi:hypothetical protein
MANWTVEADTDDDRLYITLEGHFEADEAARAADEVIETVERFDGAFEVVNDLSGFQPGDQDAMKHIQRAKTATSDAGMVASVRVMAESTTGQMQFERAGGDEEDYAVAMADSVEQAEKLLDKRREEAR